MLRLKKKFVTDDNGRKVAVQLDMKDYQKLQEYLEDLEDARELIRAERTATGFTPLKEWKRELKVEGRI